MEQPSTEVAVRQTGPSAMSLPDKIRYAQTLADSGLLPAAYKKQPANILYATEFGAMLGIAPMAAITGIHVIEGRPTASAGLIGALVRRAGHRLRVTGNDTKAVAEIVRSDDPDFVFRSEWTIERAKKAELTNKGTWKKYPAAMLKARAITEVARDACEEALSGMHYTPEELGAEVTEEGEPITVAGPAADPVDAEVVEEPNWDAELATAADDPDALLALFYRAREHAPRDTALLERIKAAGKQARETAAARAVVAFTEQLLAADAVTTADRLAGQVSAYPLGDTDVTDLLTGDDRETLAVDESTTITLGVLASEVVDYVTKFGVAVRPADVPQAA